MTPASTCCLSVSHAGVLSDDIIITRLSYDIVTRRLSPPLLSIVTLNPLLAFVPCCCHSHAVCVLDSSFEGHSSVVSKWARVSQYLLNGGDLIDLFSPSTAKNTRRILAQHQKGCAKEKRKREIKQVCNIWGKPSPTSPIHHNGRSHWKDAISNLPSLLMGLQTFLSHSIKW